MFSRIALGVMGSLAAWLWIACPASAAAQDRAALERWGEALGGSDPMARADAARALSTLGAQQLDAISARITDAERAHLEVGEIRASMELIRRGAGSRRADDTLDIEAGVIPALVAPAPPEGPPPRALRWASELLLLERSLERVGGTAAGRLVTRIVAVGGGLGNEGHRIVDRRGVSFLAALVEARAHPSVHARRWARWAIEHLRLTGAADAVQAAGPGELADVLRAHGTVRSLDAMRVIVCFVGSERTDVREAARWSMERFGVNGLWVLRDAYEATTGREPDVSWGWRRTMRELFAVHDRARVAPVASDLALGAAARSAGDLETMARHYDVALLHAPTLDARLELSHGYAELAASQRGRGELVQSIATFDRARWLSAPDPAATAWASEAALARADVAAARAVIDVDAYEQIAARSPSLRETALDHLRRADPRTGGSARARAAFLAGALFLSLGVWLLLSRRRPTAMVQPATSA